MGVKQRRKWQVCQCLCTKRQLHQVPAAAAAAAAKSPQSCPTLCDPRRQPTRLPCPWDSPGKNTGLGYHFLLQCIKVKSKSEVAQSCLTLRDPKDCSPPGFSIHGIFQARVLESGAIAFSDKNIYFCFIDYTKDFDSGKFFKRREYQSTLAASWETCMQVKKQHLEQDMEQRAGSKLGK